GLSTGGTHGPRKRPEGAPQALPALSLRVPRWPAWRRKGQGRRAGETRARRPDDRPLPCASRRRGSALHHILLAGAAFHVEVEAVGRADLVLDGGGDGRIGLQEGLGILAALADAFVAIGIPGAGLL